MHTARIILMAGLIATILTTSFGSAQARDIDTDHGSLGVATGQQCVPPVSGGPYLICSQASTSYDGTNLILSGSAYVTGPVPLSSCRVIISTGDGDSDSGEGCWAQASDGVYQPSGFYWVDAVSCVSVQCIPAHAQRSI